MKDWLDIKSDFSIYEKNPNLAYFDSASTTLVPKVSVKATTNFLDNIVVSTRRGAHKFAVKGSSIVEDTRKSLATFLESEPSSISFQKSIPSAIASFVFGYDWKHKKKEKVIISQNEENSVFVSILRTAEILGLDVDIIPLENDGSISLGFLEQSIDDKTGIVAIGHVIPGIGASNPLHEAIDIIHEHDAILLTDATRSMGLSQHSLITLGCDVLVFSANIGLMAPPGLAIQWISQAAEKNHIPGILGGFSVSDVTTTTYETAFQPDKFESGYINVPAIAGLGSSIEYLTDLHTKGLSHHIIDLSRHMKKRLMEIANLTLYGNPNDTTTIFGFNLGNPSEVGCHDIALFLDESDIAVRSGLACAHTLVQSLAEDGLMQASIHAYNSISDIDRLADTLITISKQLI
ncbi:MAG: aminotransferase class V-fold PLP-dependent enzyme [Candidatus Thorarchaeota archaeon]